MSDDIKTRAYFLWLNDVHAGKSKDQYWYYMEALRIDRLLKQGLYHDAPPGECSTCKGRAMYCCRVCSDPRCANHMHPMTCSKFDTSVPTNDPVFQFWDPSYESNEDCCFNGCEVCCGGDDYEEEHWIRWDDHSEHRQCLCADCVPTQEESEQK